MALPDDLKRALDLAFGPRVVAVVGASANPAKFGYKIVEHLRKGEFRGRPPGDLEALADAIVSLSRLPSDLEDEIAEVDLNPVLVVPPGQGGVAADALVTLRDAGPA